MISPEGGGLIYHLSIGLSVGFGESRSLPVEVERGKGYLVDGFAINDQRIKTSYREIVVTGEIVNRTGIDRDHVRFEVLCTDPVGSVLATTHFELSGLVDGVPRRFEVRMSGIELDRASRCRVRPAGDESPGS